MLAHWRLARRRTQGQALVQVYNPAYEEHGWRSPHTVVEIVTDDMPFLVDSVRMALNRHGLSVHLIIHPVIPVRRDRAHQLVDVVAPDVAGADVVAEALLHFEVDQEGDAAALQTLRDDLHSVLNDVRAAVADWPRMRERLNEAISATETHAAALPIPPEELAEDLAFLRWVDDHHFTFIGYRSFESVHEEGAECIRLIPGSGLGIFRHAEARAPIPLAAHVLELARAPKLLILTKSTLRSTVHRPTHLDYLGIKRYDPQGRLVGEWRFHGLYSSLAYDTRPAEIPLLRRKLAGIIRRSGFPPTSHAGKALQHILDTLPRDEMFQAGEEELYGLATAILDIQERQQLRVFVRPDPYRRFVSALVFVPRERYTTRLRRRFQEVLMETFDGQSSEFNVQFTESVLARVHFIIRTRPGAALEYHSREIEARMSEAMLSWQDRLRSELREQFGEARGLRLYRRYGEGFPAAYREDYTPRTAILDIQRLETVRDDKALAMRLYRPPEGDGGLLRFKVFGRRRALALSDVLPILERMGLRVLGAHPYVIDQPEGVSYWILNFDMTPARDVGVEVLRIKDIFQEAFAKVYRGDMENDGFNALVPMAGLHWREVVLVRALCKYLLQAKVPFSQSYMEQTLSHHAEITRLLVNLFHARLDPRQKQRDKRTPRLVAQIEQAIDGIASLDEDRIMRHYLAVILATVRSNYFQTDASGRHRPYLAFKLDCAQIPGLPEPRPLFEIFVYAVHVEGIHLRGGRVARGGLRWSDRREDFRTEVLGLMKAQMVKNALIVPVGAKGGFVPKRLPAGPREAVQEAVQGAYRSFVRGLLDLTDNRDRGEIVPPPAVVRHDADDPYLVVAADKGTARFSDLANEIAAQYGFWLGDAFASGGTHGYDHKQMGITARGAWESVKRHFRELGTDIQSTPFTVVGIGDMSGDVFGNAMLLSRQIRLLAAFNHQHIFIDPDPDPERAFQERARLFALPRSSWADYDPDRLSAGGGVYARSLKSITPSPQAREALGISAQTLTPNALIQAVLRAPVDLLWNGGIGTYVKAARETPMQVGDQANDGVRIDAGALRCQVIGEGGNLGLTQRARIEYALGGGMIYTDAIDNSAGVDCSDHEVNIKILLDQSVANGDMTIKQRNELLQEMTEDVARLVIRDNYLQTQAISVEAHQAHYFLSDHMRLMTVLEKEGRLKRELEALPGDEELAERESAHGGLTRPEIAVLLAYSKIRLNEQLLASDVAADPHLCRELAAYFPGRARERAQDELNRHTLRREITATHITNDITDHMGSTFCVYLQEELGMGCADIVRAYTAARETFQSAALWREIEAQDNRMAVPIQIEMIGETRRALERATRWLLGHRPAPLDIGATIARYRGAVATLGTQLPELLTGVARERLQTRIQNLVRVAAPEGLATRIAALEPLFGALDIAEAAEATGTEITPVAQTCFGLAEALDLDWLGDQIRLLPRHNRWDRAARALLHDGLAAEQRRLTIQCLRLTPADQDTETRIELWMAHKADAIARYRAILSELKTAARVDMAMLSVALRRLRALAD
jgi:glutamate dehydrogenase